MTDKKLHILQELVISGEPGAVTSAIETALDEGTDPKAILDVLTGTMDIAGEMWDRLEIFLPDVVRIAKSMKEGMDVLKPKLSKDDKTAQVQGKIILGTVEGDIHDIGRVVVGTMLEVNGFDVQDLGHDILADDFVDAAIEADADIIALSALMTTSMPFQGDVVDLLKDLNLTGKYKVLIGGGPVTVDWALEIGADGYARTAIDAVKAAKRLITEDLTKIDIISEGELT